MSRLGLFLTTIGVVAASWLGWAYASSDVPDALTIGDRVRTAVDGLKTSHVYVDPDSEGLLTPAEIAKVDAAASASQPEVFVVLWRESSESGYYLPSQGVDQLGAELGKPGYYITAGANDISADDIGITSDDYISSYDGNIDYGDGLAPGELVTGLLTMIDENDGRDFSEDDTTGSQYWGDTISVITIGALMGSMIGAGLAGLFAIAWFIERGRRKP